MAPSAGLGVERSNRMRVIKGLAALLTLAALLGGVPALLIALAGNPFPDQLSWQSAARALMRPDDGSIVMGLIAVIGWLAWFVFTCSVLIELVSLVSGFRIRVRIPGWAGPQRLAAGLLLSVVALIAVPAGGVHAAPTAGSPAAPAGVVQAVLPTTAAVVAVSPSRQTPQPDRPASLGAEQQQSAPAAGSGTPSHIHVVQRGDDLWSLAENYYGQGRDWRKIAAANPSRLSGGPDRLLPGWRLTIPDTKIAEPGTEKSSDNRTSVVVESGDSLSSIAKEAYGQQDRWVEIFDANRTVIDDPDEIEVGDRLALPPEVPRPPSRSEDARSSKAPGQAAGTKAADQSEPEPATEPAPTKVERPGFEDGPSGDRAVPTETARDSAEPSAPLSAQASTARSTEDPPPTGAQTVNHPTTDHRPSEETVEQASAVDVALGVGSVGALLAAGVVAGLAYRRRAQLQLRPLGRRIQHAAPEAQAVETALGKRQQPLTLETLDLATRAIAAHCHRGSTPLPSLAMALVSPGEIELRMVTSVGDAPVGFQVRGSTWRLEIGDAGYLSSVPGVHEAARPYPALASLGHDAQGRQVLVDLEAIGLLSVDLDRPEDGQALLAAMATEMSFSPWADEMVLTLVGRSVALAEALGKHNVVQSEDLDVLLERLERRAEVQRSHQRHQEVAQNRLDPDLADPWAPEILLINQDLTAQQEKRLLAVVVQEPRVTMAAVVVGRVSGARECLQLRDEGPAEGASVWGTLLPSGVRVVPQLLQPSAQQAVVDLVAVTGSEETTPAPWWQHGDDPPSPPSVADVTHLGRRAGGWGHTDTRTSEGADQPTGDCSPGQGTVRRVDGLTGTNQTEGSDAVVHETVGTTVARHSPILRLLGPVELTGAQGAGPPRAGKQCLEYCGWLLEHPGTTALAMASALVVAEGTRRSNMSRLRTWLGSDHAGEAYLPDAYSGRIFLHPSVSSDWQRLQILTAGGVNKTSTSGLRAALDLVRGAPLADAAPGQWHWAEELRTDMVSVIRDIGVEVASRAMVVHDIDLARWAAARALVAAPGDELLMAARIRTEHLAGNTGETERLTLQLAAQARSLGVDLDSETVVLLQEVMEGQPRARLG